MRARARMCGGVCIRKRPRTPACVYMPFSLPVSLSTLPFLLPDAYTRDRPLLSYRVRRDIPPILSALLHLPFPPSSLSSLRRGEEKPATLSVFSTRYETFSNLENLNEERLFIQFCKIHFYIHRK